MMPTHLIFRGKHKYYESDAYAAYRVKVTSWFGKPGALRERSETYIVPANSDAEAQTQGRARWKSQFGADSAHGYNIQTKRVAEKFRERE